MEKRPGLKRFDMWLPVELELRNHEWRRQQVDIPGRLEAARRLIELGLSVNDHVGTDTREF